MGWSRILGAQMVLLFMAITFTAGGVTQIDNSDLSQGGINVWSISKGVIYLFPIVMLLVLSLIRPVFFHSFLYVLKVFWILIIFLVLAGIELIWASSYEYSSIKLAIFCVSVLSLFSLCAQYFAIYQKTANLLIYRHLLFSLTIISLVLLCLALTQPVAGRNLFGGFVHPNEVASLFGSGFLLTLYYKAKLQEIGVLTMKNCFSLYAFLLISIIVFIFCFSRGAMMAFFMGYFGALFLSYLFKQSSKFVFLIFGLSVIMVLGYFLADLIASLLAREKDGSDLKNLTGRTFIWQMIFQQLNMKALLVGHGYGAISPKITVQLGHVALAGAHNSYLQVLAGTGLPGLMLFIGFLLAAFNKFKRNLLQSLNYKVDFLIGIFLLMIVNGASEGFFGINLSAPFGFFIFIYFTLVLNLKSKIRG
ncbi:MAG: O-antigen ligase family protein [Epsilonproteobacteria bacterium]|nr:O-antigen ligase family protein [Campylobacterota bacterium]